MLRIEFGYTYKKLHDVLVVPVETNSVCIDLSGNFCNCLSGFAASMIGLKNDTFVRRSEVHIDYVDISVE